MPKKFGTNTKSAEARARREELKQAEKEKKQREAEDALWKDDDKHVLRKQNRKEEKDKKKQEMLDKKATLKAAYEEEMNSLKTNSRTQTQAKMTRAEIISQLENSSKVEKTPEKELLHDEKPLEENINQLAIEGEEARTVEEAISVLSTKSADLDRHPERRVKAAYQAFEDANLPRLKAENPNLRLSQLKQMLKKEWMKSPENPLNQQAAAYNSKR